jgi:hypothetical protein
MPYFRSPIVSCTVKVVYTLWKFSMFQAIVSALDRGGEVVSIIDSSSSMSNFNVTGVDTNNQNISVKHIIPILIKYIIYILNLFL